MRLEKGGDVWSTGFMLGLRRLILGYCLFVLVLVWMLKRARRMRDRSDANRR